MEGLLPEARVGFSGLARGIPHPGFCPGNSGQQTQQIEESGKEEKRPPVAGCDRVTCHGVLGETQDGQAAEVAVSDGYPQWAQSDDAEYCPGIHANRPWA